MHDEVLTDDHRCSGKQKGTIELSRHCVWKKQSNCLRSYPKLCTLGDGADLWIWLRLQKDQSKLEHATGIFTTPDGIPHSIGVITIV